MGLDTSSPKTKDRLQNFHCDHFSPIRAVFLTSSGLSLQWPYSAPFSPRQFFLKFSKLCSKPSIFWTLTQMLSSFSRPNVPSFLKHSVIFLHLPGMCFAIVSYHYSLPPCVQRPRWHVSPLCVSSLEPETHPVFILASPSPTCASAYSPLNKYWRDRGTRKELGKKQRRQRRKSSFKSISTKFLEPESRTRKALGALELRWAPCQHHFRKHSDWCSPACVGRARTPVHLG